MLKMGSLCQKGNEYSSNLEEYFIIRLEFRKEQLESKKKADGDLQ